MQVPARATIELVEPLLRGARKEDRWVSLARFARRYPLGAAGGVCLLLVIFVAVFAGQLSPYDPLAQAIPNRLTPPGSVFWLGTDNLGRDVFSRITFGARTSLYVGFVSVALGTITGTLLGVTSGYLRGPFDLAVQRLVDTLMGFPALVLALTLVVALGSSMNNVCFAIAMTIAPRITRVARSSTLSIREELYVTGAKAIGCSTARIILRHIIPNALAPIFILATGGLGSAIIAEASLSFLGLGVPPPTPSWGGMIQLGARGYLESSPWLATFPGIVLSVVVFSFSLLGDAMRDALDPRLRGR